MSEVSFLKYIFLYFTIVALFLNLKWCYWILQTTNSTQHKICLFFYLNYLIFWPIMIIVIAVL